MAEWFDPDCTIGIRLEARNADLAVLRLTLGGTDGRKFGYTEKNKGSVGAVLAKLSEHVHQPLPGNFQLMPDFRIFVGDHLYLVKPARRRFWLRVRRAGRCGCHRARPAGCRHPVPPEPDVTAVGGSAAWTDRFRSLDTRFLRRVVAVWLKCVEVLPSHPHEDTITINLVHLLRKDSGARRLFHWLAFQFEPFGFTANGMAYSKGNIDMALLVDREHERYLAYECKRLNVVRQGARRSLATLYVTEGVARFVTEQYAESLSVGCMLGYVMDGDVVTAQTKVRAAIEHHRSGIRLKAEPEQEPSIGEVRRFVSRHLRAASGQEIEVRTCTSTVRSRHIDGREAPHRLLNLQ